MAEQTIAERIADLLQETEARPRETIAKIIDVAGPDKTAEIVRRAVTLYKAGCRTQDQTRRRTLGGCFFYVAKQDLSTHQREVIGLYAEQDKKR